MKNPGKAAWTFHCFTRIAASICLLFLCDVWDVSELESKSTWVPEYLVVTSELRNCWVGSPDASQDKQKKCDLPRRDRLTRLQVRDPLASCWQLHQLLPVSMKSPIFKLGLFQMELHTLSKNLSCSSCKPSDTKSSTQSWIALDETVAT